MKRIHKYGCRWCNERLKAKSVGSTRLVYTGLCGGLDLLKIKTRLRDERFESVKGEYPTWLVRRTSRDDRTFPNYNDLSWVQRRFVMSWVWVHVLKVTTNRCTQTQLIIKIPCTQLKYWSNHCNRGRSCVTVMKDFFFIREVCLFELLRLQKKKSVYFEVIHRELNRRLIYECRCDERQKMWEVWECDGWVCDLEVIGDPSIFSVILTTVSWWGCSKTSIVYQLM